MARKPASYSSTKTAAPLSVLLEKHPERDTRTLLSDIATRTGLAGQSRRPEAAEKALAWYGDANRRKPDATGRGPVNV